MAGERIMIVEDDKGLLPVFEGMVKMLGYELVGVASAGEQAVEVAQRQKPELVLMDIRIGGKMDGIQAAAEIHRLMGIPVVYMTAYDEQQLLDRVKPTEPYGYLIKPINPRELRVVLELALHKHRSEAALNRLNEAIHKINTDMETAYKELETFSYSAAHDLQAPLRKIASWAETLQNRTAGRLPPEEAELLRKILANTERIDDIIGDLLSFSKASLSPMARERVDLTALAADIAKDLQETQPGRKVRVSIAAGLEAEGDPGLLRIALGNLLSNAWKFTKRRPEARIEVGTATIAGRKAFFVRDDGVGFDPALSTMLFVPFGRLHSESEFKGTGIGLALAQRIVRRHNGTLWAESQPDKGAAFYFSLGTPQGI